MSVQHQSKTIPLNKLVLWNGNVRKTGGETAVDELAASIEAHGLLNPLTVGGQFRGKYYVIAGGRRLRALQALVDAGKLEKTAPVPCNQAASGVDYTEASLAENVARVAMHPADQFEAWHRLVEEGADVFEVAARFGVTESTVRKRLALARVSPIIFAAYKAEEMGLETLQAFTVTDDHALQESVWAGLESWQKGDARAIRRKLTETDVPTSDRRVQFVGPDIYEAAGGVLRRDLFAVDGGGFCEDPALLDRLVLQKLHGIADTVKREGWKWTVAQLSFPWDEQRVFVKADPNGLEDAVNEELDRLYTEAGELAQSYDEQAEGRIAEVERRIAEIEAMAEQWSSEVKAYSGAIVYLSQQGLPVIERGLIREEDVIEEQEGGIEPDGAMLDDAEDEAPALSAVLIEDLTAQKTAALRIELARSPKVALALVVYSVALSAFYRGGSNALKLHMTASSLQRSMQDHDANEAVRALEAERERVCDRLPGDEADLWDWCLTARRDDLLDVLAVAAAHGLDAVVSKREPNRNGAAFGAKLAEALKLDMTQWWQPTAGGYFSRVSKPIMLADLEAAKGVPPAPSWEKMKKTDLAALAERETAGTGWLPEPLR